MSHKNDTRPLVVIIFEVFVIIVLYFYLEFSVVWINVS